MERHSHSPFLKSKVFEGKMPLLEATLLPLHYKLSKAFININDDVSLYSRLTMRVSWPRAGEQAGHSTVLAYTPAMLPYRFYPHSYRIASRAPRSATGGDSSSQGF
jgi:hypothetical protein